MSKLLVRHPKGTLIDKSRLLPTAIGLDPRFIVRVIQGLLTEKNHRGQST